MLLAFGLAAQAATFNVTNTNDSGAGSLREAITSANAAAGADTIDATGVSGTIQLGSTLPAINGAVTLIGPGANQLTVRGNGNSFNAITLNGGQNAVFSGLTISNAFPGIVNYGTATLANCTLGNNSIGIFNDGGTATLTNCTLSDNFVGISNRGAATLTNCTLNGNSTGGLDNRGTATAGNCTFGGNNTGIIQQIGTATLTNCTISGNRYGLDIESGTATASLCTFFGNAVDGIGTRSGASATVTDCTVSGNLYGITNFGTATVTNCSLSENHIRGILNNDTANLTNCTLSGNPSYGLINNGRANLTHCTVTGSNWGIADLILGTVTLKNSLVVGNNTNIDDAVTDGGGNITDGTAAQAGLDPNGLQDNGGPTETIALLSNSPAINAGSNALIPVGITTDQRGTGYPRIVGNTVDSGAFESPFLVAVSLIVTTTADEDDGTSDPTHGTGTSLREAIHYANANAGTDNITFKIPENQKTNGIWTIQLGSALPAIADDFTLTGPGANLLTVLGGGTGSFDAFTINGGKNASFSGLAVGNSRYGLSNGGTTTLTYCTLSGNNTGFNNTGTATLTHCALSGNSTGIFGNGTSNVTNCTLGANGTGITNFGTATLTNCTLSGNTSSGIFNLGTATLKNSLVAGNTINISGSITDGGNNITSGTAAQAGLETDGSGKPVLKDNGGPTQTIALVAISPAINGGNDALIPNGITSDQRGPGFPRIAVGRVDIGAFEWPYTEVPNLVVTTTADEDNGTSDAAFGTGTSLREAIAYANSKAGADTITFNIPENQKANGIWTIQLSGTLPSISEEVTITGPGANLLTVRGGGTDLFNAFQINSAKTAGFSGLTVSNAVDGISSNGTATLTHCTLSGNYLGIGSFVLGGFGSATLTHCTLSGNSFATDNRNTATFTNCTFIGNGIAIGSHLGTATATHCTLSDNLIGIDSSGAMTLNNSLVAGNSTNINGSFTDGGGNITSGTAAQAGLETDGSGKPVLKNNGGPTQTIALLVGSPAINMGSNALIPGGITTDQRGPGFPRIVGGTVDIGAFELSFTEVPGLVVTTTADEDNGTSDPAFGTGTSLREAITYANSKAGADIIPFNIPENQKANGIWTIQLNSALPAITDEVTFIGPGAHLLTVRGGGTSSFDAFTISSGKIAGFSGLAVGNSRYGLSTAGATTVTYCTLSGNGTGISNSGTATLTYCTLSGNSDRGISNGGTANVTNCTLSGNSSFGISNNGGTATATHCTLSGNGTGIESSGSLNLKNSLVAGNTTNISGSVTDGGGNITGGTAAQAGLDPSGLQYNGGPTQTIALVSGSPAINAGVNALIPGGITTDQRGPGFPRILSGTVDIGAFESTFNIVPGLVVTTTADEDNGNSDPAFGTGTSLREAIAYANSKAGADTIPFSIPEGQKSGGIWTIQLNSALPAITDEITFAGPGANLLTVRGGGTGSFDAFTIHSGKNAGFSGLAVSNSRYGFSNGGTATVTYCTLSGNNAGITNPGTATVTHCTLSGNSSSGISNGGTLTVTNSTLSGNPSSGIDSDGTATVTNCTLSGNGTGIDNSGSLILNNSLVAGNTTNLSGSITGGGHNITSGTAAQAGLDPSGLKDNGGPTQTIALVSGSPALNTGDNALIPSGITTDQRGPGFPRILVGVVDIGAFELIFTPNEPMLAVTTTADEDNGTSDPAFGTGTSLREAIAYANSKAGADTITFSIPENQKANGIWTIQLSGGLPSISEEVTFAGPGANLLTVRGGGPSLFNAFSINSSRNAVFSGLTISNARTGIYSLGTATLTQCTLSGNSDGIDNYHVNGTATLNRCTFSGNFSSIDNRSMAILTNCTFSGNGTGISNSFGTATATHCTVSGNSIGIRNNSGTVTLQNSLVAGNATNLLDPITDGGGNITSGTAAQAGLDPNGLKDNGGPTQTISLLSGSPAINAGVNALIPGGITTDQRGDGYPRIAFGSVDIGALELQDLTNHDPIAGPDTIGRYPNQAVNVSIATLLDNDTDPDGDTSLSITAFSSPTPGGGTVTTDGTQVYYTPAPGFTSADSFTYTLIDGRGGTATGVVSVEIIQEDTPIIRALAITKLPDGTVGIVYTGIPGNVYRVQSNDGLAPQNWRDRAMVPAVDPGYFIFIDDEDPLPPNRFYRSVSP